jgi:hypothetical protein
MYPTKFRVRKQAVSKQRMFQNKKQPYVAQWFIRNDFVYLIERVKLYVLEPYPSSSKKGFLAMRGHLEGCLKNLV